MCGITGIIAFNQIGSFYMINLGKSIESLSRRGPDGRGSFVGDHIALGHRRLSIFDPSSAGRQPMSDETGRYQIVFNGEIFNYKELKKDLEAVGVQFVSDTDTEVLLKLFIQKGIQCLEDLTGFFAFAIYDQLEESVFIVRDRMGVKPLLYYFDEDKFVFASEMKALMNYNIPKEVNPVSVLSYLQLNYIPGPSSVYKNVLKLEPGHFLHVKGKKVVKEIYYSIPYKPNLKKNFSEYEAEKLKLVDLLEESVKKRLLADVPLGAFLSGGIDSSAIVALASRHTDKLKTFSIGYKDEPFFDETKYAELVAKKFNTDHTVFSLSNKDIHDHIYEILDYLDEPFADSSCIPVYILSKKVSSEVKVALSGDGGDELFGGYNKHMAEWKIRNGGFALNAIAALEPLWKLLPKSRNNFLGNKIRQLLKLSQGSKMSAAERYWSFCGYASEKQSNQLFSHSLKDQIKLEEYQISKDRILKNFSLKGDINQVLISDMDLVLVNDMLFKVDMMSMANGLEIREPFLDHHVVDFAFSLPEDRKVNAKMKKRILQDAFKEILPIEIYNRPKKGFEVPLLKWLREDLKNSGFRELFSKEFIHQQGIFSMEEIQTIQKRLYSGDPGDAHARIWGLLVFQYWWRKNMNK